MDLLFCRSGHASQHSLSKTRYFISFHFKLHFIQKCWCEIFRWELINTAAIVGFHRNWRYFASKHIHYGRIYLSTLNVIWLEMQEKKGTSSMKCNLSTNIVLPFANILFGKFVCWLWLAGNGEKRDILRLNAVLLMWAMCVCYHQ